MSHLTEDPSDNHLLSIIPPIPSIHICPLYKKEVKQGGRQIKLWSVRKEGRKRVDLDVLFKFSTNYLLTAALVRISNVVSSVGEFLLIH